MSKISIIIPVYNEKKTLKSVLEKVVGLPFDKETIVVDDGSTDGSAEILTQCSFMPITVLTHEKNKGKGAALITGFNAAHGDVVAVQDADLEYNPEELLNLAKPIFENEVDVVFGSRFLKTNPTLYWRFYFGNKVMSYTISAIAGKMITDAYTCYKLFKRDVVQSFNLKSKGFEIEAEFSILTIKGKYRFKEMPISYSPRSLEEGKKICWKDAVKGIYTAIKTKFFT